MKGVLERGFYKGSFEPLELRALGVRKANHSKAVGIIKKTY